MIKLGVAGIALNVSMRNNRRGFGRGIGPSEPEHDKQIKKGDYTYTFDSKKQGWRVAVNDKTKAKYGKILKDLKGFPVVSMDGTFKGCANLKVSPTIPNTVYSMSETFMDCTSLEVAPEIPKNVKNFNKAFLNCSELTTPPNLKDCFKIQNYAEAFYGCTKLFGTTIEGNGFIIKPLKLLTQQELQDLLRSKLETGEIIPIEIKTNGMNGSQHHLVVKNPEEFAIKTPNGQFVVCKQHKLLTIETNFDGTPNIGATGHLPNRHVFSDKSAFQCLEEALKILGSEKTVEQIMETTINNHKKDSIDIPSKMGDDVLNGSSEPTQIKLTTLEHQIPEHERYDSCSDR